MKNYKLWINNDELAILLKALLFDISNSLGVNAPDEAEQMQVLVTKIQEQAFGKLQ